MFGRIVAGLVQFRLRRRVRVVLGFGRSAGLGRAQVTKLGFVPGRDFGQPLEQLALALRLGLPRRFGPPKPTQFIRTAGYTPVERDTVYNELEVFA